MNLSELIESIHHHDTEKVKSESKINTWCKKCGYRIWGYWIKDSKKLPEDTKYCEECISKGTPEND